MITNDKQSVVLFSTLEKTLRENKFTDAEIKVIKASHEGLKFLNYKKREAANGDIAKELTAWLYLLGIKLPSKEEIILMHTQIADLIIEYFPMLTKYDLQIAIRMSIAGKLHTDNNHFNNFSPIYVTKILNSYNEYKGGIILRYKALIYDIENEKNNKITNTEKEKIVLNGVLAKFKDYNSTGDFTDYGACAYAFLTEKGYLLLTNKEKNEAKAEAIKKLKTDAENTKNKNIHKIIKAIISDSGNEEILEAKNICVKRYFDKIIAEKKDINEVLNKEIERI